VILDADPPAVGVAASRFVARLAARAGTSGRIRRVRSGDEAAFLAPLPLAVLPVDPDVTARLAGFGLDCLGAVAGLAPADLPGRWATSPRRGRRYLGCWASCVPGRRSPRSWWRCSVWRLPPAGRPICGEPAMPLARRCPWPPAGCALASATRPCVARGWHSTPATCPSGASPGTSRRSPEARDDRASRWSSRGPCRLPGSTHRAAFRRQLARAGRYRPDLAGGDRLVAGAGSPRLRAVPALRWRVRGHLPRPRGRHLVLDAPL